jgi:hypothetical protein
MPAISDQSGHGGSKGFLRRSPGCHGGCCTACAASDEAWCSLAGPTIPITTGWAQQGLAAPPRPTAVRVRVI